MYVILVGGGNIGFQLSKRLKSVGHEVTLLEKDKRHANWLNSHLGDIAVHGDGCEVRTLKEVGADRADVFAAVTGEDEDNLIACQMAKLYFKVRRTVARVNDPRHVELFAKHDVDSPISGTQLIFNVIDQEIEAGSVIPVGTLQRGSIEVLEAEIREGSPAHRKSVRDLDLPPRALLVSVIRNGQASLMSDDVLFQVGDVVVGLVSPADIAAFRAKLGPTPEPTAESGSAVRAFD